VETETLARKLGTTTHYSILLRKARRLGLRVPDDLRTLAVQRGCRHYWQGDEPEGELVPVEVFSNEELAVALLSIAQVYDPYSIRCGAAMLGADGNDPQTLARLAIWERSEMVVAYVAACGEKYESDNSLWAELLALLPVMPQPKEGVMPHPTRFVAMNGYERHVGRKTTFEWQRPRRFAA
jgi:hypothetical protein